jgi:hypothetical protein
MRGRLAIVILIALVALVVAKSGAADSTVAVFVNCGPRVDTSSAVVARQHPRKCNIWGEPPNIANLRLLRRMRWSAWGTASAVASGRLLNAQPGMGGPTSYPVRVRLFRIRRGCDGRLYYTRAQAAVPGYRSAPPLHVTPTCKLVPLS